MICYTFGAPRTGNHTWAREYEELVPDTWHIINDQVCSGVGVPARRRPGVLPAAACCLTSSW